VRREPGDPRDNPGAGGGGGGHRGLIPRGRARRAKTERAQWSRDHQTNNTVLPPPFVRRKRRPTDPYFLLFFFFSSLLSPPPTPTLSQATDVVDLLRNAALRSRRRYPAE